MSIPAGQKSLSYARGFKVPKKLDIDNALGKFDDNNRSSVFTENFYGTFGSLPLPTKSSDWLAQYAEKGQTYTEFLQLSRTLHTPLSSHRKTIYLTVFGAIDNTILGMDSLIDYTRRFFQMQVKLIKPFIHVQWNDEKSQWTCAMTLTDGRIRNFNLRSRYNEETKHSQICVTGILNLLKKVVPCDARCLVALTMYDLYGNDTDLFIAGLAMGNCRVAAFSLYRYDPYLTFDQSDWFNWTLKTTDSKSTDSKSTREITVRRHLLLLRACRLLTHEICHLLAIDHCIFYSCLLNGSGDLEEDFGQPLLECPIDLRKLYILINFNIHQRYEQLLEFFQLHNFLDEITIVETKLNVINTSMNSNTSNCNSDGNSNDLSTSTKTRKRKCTYRMTPKKDVLANVLTGDKDVSHSQAKHLKC